MTGHGSHALVRQLVASFLSRAVDDVTTTIMRHDRQNRRDHLRGLLLRAWHGEADDPDLPFDPVALPCVVLSLYRSIERLGGADDTLRAKLAQWRRFGDALSCWGGHARGFSG